MAATLRVETPWTYISDGQLQRPLAADPLQRRGVELDAPGLRHLDGERPEPGVQGLRLEPVGIALALLGSLVGGGPEGTGPFELHDLVEQDGDGPGHPVEAVLGQEFRDLIEGGSLHLAGHRRSSPRVGSLPSKEPAMACRFKTGLIYRSQDALPASGRRRGGKAPTTVAELAEALGEFKRTYNERWTIRRRGHRTP